MRIVPTFNFVLIQPDGRELTTPGGIALPDYRSPSEDEYGKSTQWEIGTIMAVGPGMINDDGIVIETRLQIGRKVVFKAYSGQQFEDGPFKNQCLIPSSQVAGYVE